jgi:ATP-binding cassette subfamily B protein
MTLLLRNMFKSFDLARRTLALAWRSSPSDVAVLGLLTTLQGLFPAFTIYITKLIVDSITGETSNLSIPILVTLWGLALILGQAVEPWRAMVSGNLNERFSNSVLVETIRKANSFPDLEPFEKKEFYEDLQTVYNESEYRPSAFVYQSITIGTTLIAAFGLLFLLGSVAWWIPFLVLITSVPNLKVQESLERQGFWRTQNSNQHRLMMSYMRRVTTTDEFAKEIRVYGLGSYFEKKYLSAFESMHASMRELRSKKAYVPMPYSLIAIAGNVFSFFWIINEVSQGNITAGSAVLFVQSLAQFQGWMDAGVRTLGYFSGTLEFFGKLFSFLSATPSMKLSASARAVPSDITIRFEGVSFAYPDGREALHNVSFEVKPGERIALVGENGAGKSTIVKLLARLYDPIQGRITIGDVDLRDIDIEAWRAIIGAVFQDFVKYQLTVRENIAVGSLSEMDNSNAIELAAKKAGFDLSKLGLSIMLGKQFDGTELSGGQWQKLATARAFLRDAHVLVLDEPSAALDPESEATLFEHFMSLSAGKSTFLVTHRLASTAKADRILVLKDGCLVEEGGHFDLLRRDGVYAAMYQVQAAQYENHSVK